MRNSSVSLRKVAVVRDDSYPVGTRAPLHLKCYCGARPLAVGDKIKCECGTVYDRDGWIIEGNVPV